MALAGLPADVTVSVEPHLVQLKDKVTVVQSSTTGSMYHSHAQVKPAINRQPPGSHPRNTARTLAAGLNRRGL